MTDLSAASLHQHCAPNQSYRRNFLSTSSTESSRANHTRARESTYHSPAFIPKLDRPFTPYTVIRHGVLPAPTVQSNATFPRPSTTFHTRETRANKVPVRSIPAGSPDSRYSIPSRIASSRNLTRRRARIQNAAPVSPAITSTGPATNHQTHIGTPPRTSLPLLCALCARLCFSLSRARYSVRAMTQIRIGSRGSQLALWQANHIAAILRTAGHAVEIEVIRTTGDRMQDPGFVPPPGLDGKGIFIKEIEEALAAGRIDLAVHSLKDLPTTLDPRFTLAAIPTRADARDAFVCEPFWALHTLPENSVIGTNSPRRRAQLLHLRPDLQFVELRGNIDTRLRKLDEGQNGIKPAALVLACAGLDRIGRTESVHQRFAVDELTPAPGQGALALETRSPHHPLDTENAHRDPEIHAAIAALDCPETRRATTTERAFLHAMGGGCELPLGAFSTPDGLLHAQVLTPDGDQSVCCALPAAPNETPEAQGQRAAQLLIDRGARDLLSL